MTLLRTFTASFMTVLAAAAEPVLAVPPAPFAAGKLARPATEFVQIGSGKGLETALVCGDKRIHLAADWPGPNTYVISEHGRQLMQLSYWANTPRGAGSPFNDAPVEQHSDREVRRFGFARRFALARPDDSSFVSTVSALPDGRLALAWENTAPVEGGDLFQALQISSAPYGAFEGVRIGLGDRRFAFAPAGESPGKRVLYQGPFDGPLVFMPDRPDKALSLSPLVPCDIQITESRKPEDVGKPYQYAAVVTITPKERSGLRLTLDLGESAAESLHRGDSFAGIDFWREDRLHVPRFAACRNLLANPSYEGGQRYWNDAFWWDVTQDSFSIDEGVAWRGRRSQKQFIRRGVPVHMIGHFVVPTIPGRTYTLSFHGRTDSPGFTAGFRTWEVDQPPRLIGQGNWPLSSGWTRHSGSFVAAGSAVVIAQHPSYQGPAETGTGWIDGVQLEEGAAATDYVEDPVTATLLTATRGNCLRPGALTGARLRIAAPTGSRGTVDCRIVDFLYTERFSATLPFTVDAGGETTVPLQLDGRLGPGIHVATTIVRLPDGTTSTDWHRLSVLDPAPVGPNRGMFASMFSPTSRYEDFVQRCADLGFGSTCYAHREQDYRILARHGITNLGGSGIVTHGLWHAPEVRKDLIDRLLDEPYSDELAGKLEEFSCNAVKANPWIETWFMAAEPALQFRLLKEGNDDEGYVKYILACRRGAKRADPGKPFLFDGGPDNMNPRSGIAAYARWLPIAARLAPSVRFDGFAIHPYRYAPEQPDLDEDTATFLALLAKHGYTREPVIFNEGIYNAPLRVQAWQQDYHSGASSNDRYRLGSPTYDMGWAERMAAAYYARSWLVSLKYGDRVKQLNGWCQNYLSKDADMVLTAIAMVPNTLSHLLVDARFVQDIRFAVGTRSYVFEDGRKRPVAAVWSHLRDTDRGEAPAPQAHLRLDLRGLEVFSLMGERLAVHPDVNGSIALPVTPFPLFLRGQPGSTDALCTALHEAEVDGSQEFPLTAEMRLASRSTAGLALTNRISKPFTGTIAVAGDSRALAVPKAGRVVMPVPLATPVPFDAIGDLSLPLTITNRSGTAVNRAFAFHAFAVAMAGASQAPWIPLTNWRGYTPAGHGGFAAAFRLAWSPQELHLEVRVADPRPAFAPDGLAPGQSYIFDSLQIYLDTLGDNADAGVRQGQGEAFGYDNYGYIMARTASGKVVVYREAAPDQQLAGGLAAPKAGVVDDTIPAQVVQHDGGYTYLITFPRRLVAPLPLQAGTSARLGLMVNDNDGNGRIGGLVSTASPGTEPNSSPEEWPAMLLVE